MCDPAVMRTSMESILWTDEPGVVGWVAMDWMVSAVSREKATFPWPGIGCSRAKPGVERSSASVATKRSACARRRAS